MAAVAVADYRVHVVDIDTRRVVRVFSEHSGRITDLAWTADGRWLLTSCMDGAVRTWDMPSGRLLSAFRVADAVTSLALSPAGDTLATTHVNTLGLVLWTNRSLFAAAELRPLPHGVDVLDLPIATAEGGVDGGVYLDEVEAVIKAAEEEGGGKNGEFQKDFVSPPQMGECITLSGLPRARWTVLPSLAIIRERNKPIQPPSAPAAAPFFLPAPSSARDTPSKAEAVSADETGNRFCMDRRGKVYNRYSLLFVRIEVRKRCVTLHF